MGELYRVEISPDLIRAVAGTMLEVATAWMAASDSTQTGFVTQ